MTTNNLTLYKLLVKFGATEEEAAKAAVIDASDFATKGDLNTLHVAIKGELAELKASIIMWMIGIMLAQTALVFAITRR